MFCRRKLKGLIGRIKKFLDLPTTEQRKIADTAMRVAAFRLGLWVVPYRLLRPLADTSRRPRAGSERNEEIQNAIADKVSLVSYFFPEATCLTQALAAHVLLRREGFDPKLQLGVARDNAGKFIAHAWIECDGRIVIGGGSEGRVDYKALQVAGLPLRDSSRESVTGP